MIKTTREFWVTAISHLPPELQTEARKALAEKRITPELIEAMSRAHAADLAEIEKAVIAVNDDAALRPVLDAISDIAKRLPSTAVAGTESRPVVDSAQNALNEKVQGVRNDLRKIEDKLDTLRPHALWKLAVVATLALVVGAVASWNIRPAYKQWQWEEQQKEGR